MPNAEAKKKQKYFNDNFEWNSITVHDFERSTIIMIL